MASSETSSLKPGVAYIKPEFLVIPPSDSSKGTGPTDVNIDGNKSAAATPSDGDTPPTTAVKRLADDNDGYHNKPYKQKRGQNKQRPRLKKEMRCNKLCRYLWAATEQDYKNAGISLPTNDASKQNGSNGNVSVVTAVEPPHSESHQISSNSEENKVPSTMPNENVSDDAKVDDSTNTASSNGNADSGESFVPVESKEQEDENMETKPSSDTSAAAAALPPQSAQHPLCLHGSCNMSHDVASFLDNKPKDIRDECHNFRTFGFCEYGVICRFGSEHIRNGCNIRDEQLWKKGKVLSMVSNILPRETQYLLRKKKYVFHKAKAAGRRAQKDKIKKQDSVTVPSAAVVDASQTSEANGSDAAVAESGCTHSVEQEKTESEEGTCAVEKKIGPAPDGDLTKLRPEEKKKVVWRDQLYLAPLTTLGNLPFRRICRSFGADITCGEMAMAKCLLQANPGEWALIKRHPSESVFGVQLCGSNPDIMVKCSELLAEVAEVDFVDINVGCPIDFVYQQGAGSGLMRRAGALELMVRGMSAVLPCPLTVKIRTAIHQREKTAHNIIKHLRSWGADLVTLHGRSREQRYTKSPDWDYIGECARVADPLPLFGNGDVLNFDDYQTRKTQSGVAGIMIARGALMKPWIFTEIKEKRHWDISSSERFDILKDFVNNGLEHWGSDAEGVEKIRRFLLEWLSFLYRYIPLGLLERPPQAINQKPPLYVGRDHLETLMASKDSQDWVKISEMLLGPVPEDFIFLPKHKANAWA